VGVIVLVLFVVMVLRLWSLQVIDAKTYAAAVNANQIRTVSVPPPRGLIVDRKNTVLVGNKVETEIVLSRDEATQDPSVIGKVAALVGETPAQVKAAITDKQYSPYEPVPVLLNARRQPSSISTLIPATTPGSPSSRSPSAHIPNGDRQGNSGHHVLGYVGAITATFLKDHPTRGTHSRVRSARPGSSPSTSSTSRASQAPRGWRSTPGDVVGPSASHRPPRATRWCSTSQSASKRPPSAP